MHKLMAVTGAAAILAASTFAALAAEATGTITSVDVASSTLTLDDGKAYKLPQSVDAASLTVGQPVTIQFETGADGSNMATSVQ